MDALDHIADICSREVKEEYDNSIQISLTMLSAYTKNPQNLRILAQTGEGKTYLVNHVSTLFPQENIIKLRNASPQSFKYLATKKVIEASPGIWQDYDIALEPLQEELKKTKIPERKKEIEKQIEEYKERTYLQFDFNEKTLIFLDSQSFALWESLKSNLSHDDEYLKSYVVNKSNTGKLRTSKVVFKGWPAVIYCSAKDEVNRDKTDEINTRFNTISFKGSQKKYREMLRIKSLRNSLPTPFYQKKIISDDEIEQARNTVKQLIEIVKKYGDDAQPILNLYGDAISEQFKADAGYRSRQLDVLESNITVLTLANASQRPKIIVDETEYPVALKSDVIRANELTKEPMNITLTKIQFFNKHIKPAIKVGKEKFLIDGPVTCASAREIADEIKNNNPEITTNRKKLLETYLQPLAEHGYLEEFEDPDNRKQHLFFLAPRYQKEDASIESTFIDISSIDDSCLNVFKEKWLNCRFDSETRMVDMKGGVITFPQLLDIVTSIDDSDT